MNEQATDKPAASKRPLFRPEAMEEPEFGEALAFSVPRWKAIGLVALAALALILVFSLFADFDRTATVRGEVVPASGVSRLLAPQAGIVSAVEAEQGTSVVPGAPLIRIATTEALPGGEAAYERMAESWRRQQQLSQAGRAADRRRRDAERRRLAQNVSELSASLSSLDAQQRLQRQRIESNEERLASLGQLRQQGYVSAVAYHEQEEAVLMLRQQLAVLEQQESENRHALSAARIALSELAAETEAAELSAQATQLEIERGTASAEIQAEVTVTAPAPGEIASMRAVPGMAVDAREELATIVRPGDALEALLFVPPAAAGSLAEGQEVALRYDAFPYQRYGVGRGTIAGIAETATVEAPNTPPVYRVRVTGLEGDFALRPDMTLTANIIVERRTLLDWLFTPLREQAAGNTR